jgi:hypothetical protein
MAHFGIESVAIHAEIGGGVALADDAGEDHGDLLRVIWSECFG